MVTYQIKVYASLETCSKDIRLFERMVTLPESCDFDFRTITTALRILYGTKCVIQINYYSI